MILVLLGSGTSLVFYDHTINEGEGFYEKRGVLFLALVFPHNGHEVVSSFRGSDLPPVYPFGGVISPIR